MLLPRSHCPVKKAVQLFVVGSGALDIPCRPKSIQSINGSCGTSQAVLCKVLQLITVPKARTKKFPFWDVFDPRDHFAHSSTSLGSIDIEAI
jgi:hypothetical protein